MVTTQCTSCSSEDHLVFIAYTPIWRGHKAPDGFVSTYNKLDPIAHWTMSRPFEESTPPRIIIRSTRIEALQEP